MLYTGPAPLTFRAYDNILKHLSNNSKISRCNARCIETTDKIYQKNLKISRKPSTGNLQRLMVHGNVGGTAPKCSVCYFGACRGILDYALKTLYCHECIAHNKDDKDTKVYQKWKEMHSSQCSINHTGLPNGWKQMVPQKFS